MKLFRLVISAAIVLVKTTVYADSPSQTDGGAEVLVRTVAKSAGRFMPAFTLAEILGQNHAAVIARRANSDENTLKNLGNAPFEIRDVLKGQRLLKGSIVDARVLREDSKGELFLLLGKHSKSKDAMHWRVAESVTPAYREHALAVTKLKGCDTERLTYFQPLLEHPDQSVSANAHMEFVVASDDAFTSGCERLDRTKIRQWLAEPNIAVDRHWLYLAMLARCGNSVDAGWLHQELMAKESPQSLVATLGCYLALKGEAGLSLLHTRYMDNTKATYIKKYAAVRALRFVSTLPSEPLSRKSIIESYRLLLRDNATADLVIPELMRLNDWESIGRIVSIYKEPDAKYCKVAIVNFVRACPASIAKERLNELAELDPEPVQRAKTFFPQMDLKSNPASLRRAYARPASGC